MTPCNRPHNRLPFRCLQGSSKLQKSPIHRATPTLKGVIPQGEYAGRDRDGGAREPRFLRFLTWRALLRGELNLT
jgi:hypothetical protein